MKKPIAALLVCVVTQVHGQQITSPVSSIRVTGAAVAAANPERAQIDVGVLTQERQSATAASQNARQIDSVLSALHKLLGPDADIKTVNFSLSPDYQYRPIGGKPSIASYTVLHVVRITLDDVDKAGSVIDTATQAGANHVESVQFMMRDPQALHAQVLREATARARANADALASALNLKVLRILSAEEVREPPPAVEVPEPDSRSAPGDSGAQAGSLDVTANVTLTAEVGTR